ncbi:unnamed protein product [Rotaria magnacalcarata]|uniref:Uncharacterized protein n=1 Tax=Rotaria magnacalcarata TaxID=392030 RepID=A0A816N4J1_9BILA|nr:unnamed protein product [Rotaria magnacalcarata]
MGSDTSKPKKHPTQLTEDEVQLLLKNTRFNRKQIMEWHQGFLNVDSTTAEEDFAQVCYDIIPWIKSNEKIDRQLISVCEISEKLAK